MKDFFKRDEAMIDLMILAGVILFIYVSRNITPLTPSAVMSGETTGGFLSFIYNEFHALVSPGFLHYFANILGVLAVMLLGGVFLLNTRIAEIKKEDREKYTPVHAEETEAKAMQVQWQVVLNHVNSESPAEWKLAILEADSMLDEILEIEGYQGDSLGEKLKAMSPSAIQSYNDLWEAHKMRNQIAHEGTDAELNKKIARDTINKFGAAFKELGHI